MAATRRTFVLGLAVMLVVPVLAQGAGLAALVDQWLPRASRFVDIKTPMAAVSADGSVWLSWVQVPRIGLELNTDTANLGVFCRLMTPDGSEVFGTRRLTSGRQYRDYFHAYPYPFYLTVTPSGGAALFLYTHTAGTKDATQIVLLDRSGAARNTRIDFAPNAGDGWLDAPRVRLLSGVGTFQICFAPDGVMHCFFWSTEALAVASLDPSGSLPPVVNVKTYHPFGSEDSASALDTMKLRLVKLAGRRDLTSVLFTRTDTVAAAFVEPRRGHASAKGGGDLVVYTFSLPSLTPCGSFRAPADSVAGADRPGVRLPSAILAPVRSGFAYLVSGREVTSSYMMSPTERPQVGRRAVAPIVPTTKMDSLVCQAVHFIQTKPRQPWRIEWFALDRQGVLHHDAHVCESVPGRLR